MTMHVSMGYRDIEGGGTFFSMKVDMNEVVAAMKYVGYSVDFKETNEWK